LKFNFSSLHVLHVGVCWLNPLRCFARLVRGKSDAKDAKRCVAQAQRAIVLQAAARAWAHGVPWAESLCIAEKAISKASPKAKALPKSKAKAKAVPKGKAKAKALAG